MIWLPIMALVLAVIAMMLSVFASLKSDNGVGQRRKLYAVAVAGIILGTVLLLMYVDW